MSTDIYHLGRRKLTIWKADGNQKRVCISTYRPLPKLTKKEWTAEVVRILEQNELYRAAKWEGRALDPQPKSQP